MSDLEYFEEFERQASLPMGKHGWKPLGPSITRVGRCAREKQKEPVKPAIADVPVQSNPVIVSFQAIMFAEILSYSDLRDSLRQRADQLQVSRRTIDNLAGLCEGLTEKILGRGGTKTFGITSLGLLLAALGVKLILVEDPKTRAEFDRRNPPKRIESNVRYKKSNGASQHV